MRQKIRIYGRDKLEHIILEMYKAIPHSVREAKRIDSVITNPDAELTQPSAPIRRELDEIRCETEEFLSHAYNQYYFAPNSVVLKNKRPGWRFTARRLFKELNHAADSQNDAPAAADLLKSLYKMLCYSCRCILFSGYDSFDFLAPHHPACRATVPGLRRPPVWLRPPLVCTVSHKPLITL